MFSERDEVWLSPREAAAYVQSKGGRATEATLATLRSNGGGPRFSKRMSAIYYRRATLDKWIEKHSSPEVESTSELRKARE
jgi:hypothetical protein